MTPTKTLLALLATSMVAGFGYAVAQSAATPPADPASAATTTTTTTETQTIVVPAPTTGVVPSQPPGTYTAAPGVVTPQSTMTTGVTHGSTRINVGDHASPQLPRPPQVQEVTKQVTTTTVAPEPAPAPMPAEPAAAPAPQPEPAAPMATEPEPAPRADRN